MIAAAMFHAFAVALPCAGAAWLLEAASAAYARPRRFAWVLGLVAALFVPLAAWLAPSESLGAGAGIPSAGLTGSLVDDWTGVGREAIALYVTRADQNDALPPLDLLLGSAWLAWSTALLVYFAIGWRRLSRSARAWQPAELESQRIDVSDDIGPAVFGVFRARIVFPRWLLDAPAQTQALALRHEREHVAARDPLLLAIATGVVLLMPWNLPLWWMLRRLRFALEIDCDRRVVTQGADSTDYGLALLTVSERQRPAPFATALIERPSQLEQRIRIMFATPRKLPALAAGACLLLAASCLYAATTMDVPTPNATTLKPPPGGEQMLKLGQSFEQYIGQRYAGLFERKVDGTPVVIMLVNDDMTILKSAQILLAEPIEKIEVDESMFASIGMKRDQVPYAGAMAMQSPTDPAQKVLAVYTEQRGDEKRFVSRLFTDTRSLDRDIYQQQFPRLAKNGVPKGTSLWVLIDREGHVLRSGQEPMAYDKIAATLEARFAGIKTREVTVTPLYDAGNEPVADAEGRDVHLTSVWLAPDSPPPGR
jgi:hypothetical protein